MQKIQILHQSGQVSVESQSLVLADENKMLIEQLHLVQEELERLHQDRDVPTGVLPPGHKLLWVDDELPDVLAENTRLQTRLAVQAQIHQCESTAGLNSQLGTLLIQSVDHPASLWALPGKLWNVWRSYHKQPPAVLGGKSFDKVLEAWGAGGLPAVEALLENAATSPFIQANAYTAVARSLVHKDSRHAAEASRRAYALDPKPYRLKWLALRLHEAGELAEAEVMLEALPADIQISESEAKQIRQLRHEAEYWRKLEAKRQTGYAEKRAKVEATIRQLTEQCTEQAQQLEAGLREIAQLKRDQSQWQQDSSSWQQRSQQQQAALAECQGQLAALSLDGSTLQQENAELQQQSAQLQEEHRLLLEQVTQLQEAVESHYRQAAVVEQEKALLLAQCDAYSRSVLAHEHERESLLKQLAAAEQKQAEQLQSGQTALAALQSELHTAQAERASYAAEQASAIATLQQAKAALEQDKSAQAEQLAALQSELHTAQAERASYAAEQTSAIAALQQAKAALDQDKSAQAAQLAALQSELNTTQAELASYAAEQTSTIAALQQAKAVLEQDKNAQAVQLAALQTELSAAQAERQAFAAQQRNAIEALQQVKAKLEADMAGLVARSDDQSKVLNERSKHINELEVQIQQRQAAEAELTVRQQHMQEELVRAEAQLDLIKVMVLKEEGL